MRPSLIKYNVLFTLEEIVLNSAQLDGSVNLRESFSDRVYQNERDIFASYKLSYPSQF